MSNICYLALFIILAVLHPLQVSSQSTNGNGVPTVNAFYSEDAIQIDGVLSEPLWQKANPATHFIQGEPVEGAPAEEQTEVRVLYDKDALYVSAIMFDSEPNRIGTQLVRRDEWGAYDFFELSLDSNNDRLTGYVFRVSAAGVQRDVYLYDDIREDEAWDAIWDSAVHIDANGWIAELRIPLSQIRYNSTDTKQSWGVNFSRRRIANNEHTYFALESRLQHGKVSVFGRLNGLQLSNNSSRRFEVRPYALSNSAYGPVESGNPFFDGSSLSGRVGVDLRYGLGSDYTLDVTVNPDFGQVEVDPAVINLTEFETFFEEKRPFFVEDAQIFDFDLSGRRNQLFYSRRIGREPRGSEPDGSDFEDIPTQTTILGAAKLTGRSSDGLSIGALAALTSEENGRAFLSSLEKTQKFPVEPRGIYGVVRARQEFNDGTTQLGGILTATSRGLPKDKSLDFLNSNAYSFGIDFEHTWGGERNRNWGFTGRAVGSYVKGTTEAIREIQESSNHYFQRPDAIRFSLDSTATNMRGIEWGLELERLSGEHWTGSIWLNEITPGFEINDLGFSTSGERFSAGTRITYQEIKPGSLFRNYEFRFFATHDIRHSVLENFSWRSLKDAYDGGRLSVDLQFGFLNYWEINFDLSYSAQNFSDTATRGGPLMVEPGSRGIEIRANTDRRKSINFEPSFNYEDGLRGGYEWEAELETTIRPSSGWEIELQPSFGKELNPSQYVDTVDDIGYTPTYGKRYIFGELKQKSFSLATRLNISFSPKLTIQFYAQPLISSGQYLKYKQLLRPKSFDFDEFDEGVAIGHGDLVSCFEGRTCVQEEERYIDFDGDGVTDLNFSDEDFTFRSLKLNGVLRWEYRPGSTLFLVWQSSRRSEISKGSFDLSNSLDSLWNTEPDNAFILKLNYWFSL
jgi:hypothetical protein